MGTDNLELDRHLIFNEKSFLIVDFIANGPREPGVGAELVSPQKIVNYDMEFSQLNGNTMKDITNNQFNKCNRTEEYNVSKILSNFCFIDSLYLLFIIYYAAG